MFFPVEVAPSVKTRVELPEARSTSKTPVEVCSTICKFVLVIVPHKPAFSPVVMSSNCAFVE